MRIFGTDGVRGVVRSVARTASAPRVFERAPAPADRGARDSSVEEIDSCLKKASQTYLNAKRARARQGCSVVVGRVVVVVTGRVVVTVDRHGNTSAASVPLDSNR